MKYPILLTACLALHICTLGQRRDSIISEKVFTITEAYKFQPDEVVKTPFHASIEKDTIQRENSVNFVLEPQSLYYPYLPLATNPLAYQDENPKDSFRHYVKLGYGNFSRPLVKTGFTLGKSTENPIDINFLYDQSKGKKRLQDQRTISGDIYTQLPIRNHDELSINAKVSDEKRNLFGVADWSNTSLSEDSIKNNWFIADLSLNFSNAQIKTLNKMHFQPAMDLSYVQNSFDRTEIRTNLMGHVFYSLSRKWKFDFNPFVNFQNTRSNEAENNTIAGIAATTMLSTEKVRANLKLELNTLESVFFGTLNVQVPLKAHSSYFEANLGKDYIQNSMRSLYTDNNYIRGVDNIENTIRNFVSASFHASPIPLLDASLFIDYSNYEDYAYFTQTTNEVSNNYFDINYTSNLSVLTFGAELKLDFLQKYRIYTKLVSYSYNQDIVSDRLAYIPGFEGKIRADIPILDKLSTYFNMLMYSGRYDFVDGQVQNLKSYADLGIGATYEVKPQLKLWLDCSNLLNQELDYYFHYPSLGINFRGGILYLF